MSLQALPPGPLQEICFWLAAEDIIDLKATCKELNDKINGFLTTNIPCVHKMSQFAAMLDNKICKDCKVPLLPDQEVKRRYIGIGCGCCSWGSAFIHLDCYYQERFVKTLREKMKCMAENRGWFTDLGYWDSPNRTFKRLFPQEPVTKRITRYRYKRPKEKTFINLPFDFFLAIACSGLAGWKAMLAIPEFGRFTLTPEGLKMAERLFRRDEIKTYESETIRYESTILGSVLHSFDDKPASTDGSNWWWYRKGKKHRDGDKPAMITASGSKFWYRNGLSHRDGDMPADVWADGRLCWIKNGKRYRENGGPTGTSRTMRDAEGDFVIEEWGSGCDVTYKRRNINKI